MVLSRLVLNGFGQGALVLSNPAAIDNLFHLVAPAWMHMTLVLVATLATIIASQAIWPA